MSDCTSTTPEPQEKSLPLNDITADDEIQPRAKIDSDLIDEYRAMMEDGVVFPAVVVVFDGANYWLADGFHRFYAAKRNGSETILAKVRGGTRRDAMLYAAGANATHGLRRTNADKRRAVLLLLYDSEWGEWSSNQIAQKCVVSPTFVGNLRKAAVTDDSSLSTVDSDNESDDRDDADPVPDPKPTEKPRARTYRSKHGTKAKMKVNKIGGKRRQPQPPALAVAKTDEQSAAPLVPTPIIPAEPAPETILAPTAVASTSPSAPRDPVLLAILIRDELKQGMSRVSLSRLQKLADQLVALLVGGA